MSARFVWSGLEEFKAALRELPAHLAGEATHIVEGHANAAGVKLRTAYGQHRDSGDLQDHVVIERKTAGPFGVAYRVASTARHAWLFDNGSQARHWASGKSTGAMWGKTPQPPTHVFVGTMIATRRSMYGALAELLTRNGLVVSGDA